MSLSKWQSECLEEFKSLPAGQREFLVVAWTGTGKTIMGVECASRAALAEEYKSGARPLVVVVGPSRQIKRGWEDRFSACAHWKAAPRVVGDIYDLDDTVDVLVMTYQAVISQGTKPRGGLRQWISDKSRTLILVLDEVHHVGETRNGEDGDSWAGAMSDTFGGIYSKLIALTATPFRESGRIRFLERYYVEDGNGHKIAKPDFEWGYADDLRLDEDRNTVRVRFQGYHAKAASSYYCKDTGKKTGERDHSTQEMHDYDPSKPRCECYVCKAPVSSFVPTKEGAKDGNLDKFPVVKEMLIDACGRLNEIRRDQDTSWAGGLVVASDVVSAKLIADYMANELHESVTVVTSDEPSSQGKINAFRKDVGSKWIVAVDMISEGVDVPRLKVLVSVGTKTTMQRIIQEVGRVLRRHRKADGTFYPGPQDAFVYHVTTPVWRYVAGKIEGYCVAASRAMPDPNDPETSGPPPPEPKTRREIDSVTKDGAVVTAASGELFEEKWAELADWLWNTNYRGARDRKTSMRSLLETAREFWIQGTVPRDFTDMINRHKPSSVSKIPPPAEPTYRQKKERLRTEISRIVNQIAFKIDQADVPGDIRPQAYVGSELNQRCGLGPTTSRKESEVTLEQLEAKLEAARSWLAQINRGRVA